MGILFGQRKTTRGNTGNLKLLDSRVGHESQQVIGVGAAVKTSLALPQLCPAGDGSVHYDIQGPGDTDTQQPVPAAGIPALLPG